MTLNIVATERIGNVTVLDFETGRFQPTIRDYLSDMEYASGKPDGAVICADIFQAVRECYVPEQTIEAVEVFSAGYSVVARLAGAVFTKLWLTEQYDPAQWPQIARPFAALLRDPSERVVLQAGDARRAFIGAADSQMEAYRRRNAVRGLMPRLGVRAATLTRTPQYP